MTDTDNSGTWRRRQFIKATGVTAGVGLLAGCSSQTYTAETVVLPDEAQQRLRFAPVLEETRRTELSGSVAGQDVSATIVNSVAVYTEATVELSVGTPTPTDSADGSEGSSFTGGTVNVGVLSTPAAKQAGQSLNPLGRLDLAELLTNERALQLLNDVSEGDLDVEWARQPEQLSTAEGTLLDQSTTIETHAGLLDTGTSETPTLVYIHLARVETDTSVVIAAGVQAFDVEDTGRAYVGPDGYQTQQELEAARETVAGVDAALVVE